ncbi:MAG: hypothetical protein J6A63_08890 [Clostridia bacterium]|nr:hypothetical protein [Clostridia bacterium]
MSRNNEKIYEMVERPTEKVVGVGAKAAEKIDKVGDNRRGCVVGVLSSWVLAKLFYPSGVPP